MRKQHVLTLWKGLLSGILSLSSGQITALVFVSSARLHLICRVYSVIPGTTVPYI
jgi:hypothetical protein